jgi:hypothetical protein
MILWGGASLLRPPSRVERVRGASILAGALRAVHAQPPAVRALVMGLLTTLLPCGFLYAFVAVAAGTAHVPSGVLVMIAFWLGTVPAMWGAGMLAQRVLAPLRRRAPLATACALIVLGALTMTGKFRPVDAGGPSHAHSHAPSAGEDASQ